MQYIFFSLFYKYCSVADLQEDTKVATEGGRYDVDILRRKKMSVYWDETDGEVRRCAWFVKCVINSRYIPYDENIAALLEVSKIFIVHRN